jgi:CO dehydrogenase maturation factor
MKLGIVGKGGVGKTTVASLVAREYASRGRRVVAVETDSNPNLGMSLGLDPAATEAVPELPRSFVVGARGDATVAELMADYGRTTPAAVTLLSAIRVAEAGAGCTCAGHATVRSFLGQALDEHADVTVVDMEAGLEHLSRSGGTLAHVDALLAVMEPSRKSVLTVARTQALADELGIPRTYGVGNKARLPDDQALFESLCGEYGVPLVGVVPLDDDVTAADRAGTGVAPDGAVAARSAVARIADFLDAAGAT